MNEKKMHFMFGDGTVRKNCKKKTRRVRTIFTTYRADKGAEKTT